MVTTFHGLGRVEVLCISNGHGEDEIAVRIGLAMESRGFQVLGLPLVGEGQSYQRAKIPIWGEVVQAMPTGGFVRMEARQLWRDVRSGLLRLTWRQLQAVWQWSTPDRLILAVGDIVPLVFAWLASWRGSRFVFMATAKSEYYWRDEASKLLGVDQPWGGSFFYPWERWLMDRPACQVTFVRDALTAHWLQKYCRRSVLFLGNPMMDRLTPTGVLEGNLLEGWIVTILPGSRPPEAYDNFALLLSMAEISARTLASPVQFLVALAGGIGWEVFAEELLRRGWQSVSPPEGESEGSPIVRFFWQKAELLLVVDGFADCLHACHFGMAMAGTATEQLVGLGKPVITIAGQGPQFTRQFALDQTRLLGSSVVLVQYPEEVASVIVRMQQDPDFFQSAASNGQRRMGAPGASDRIGQLLAEMLLEKPGTSS